MGVSHLILGDESTRIQSNISSCIAGGRVISRPVDTSGVRSGNAELPVTGSSSCWCAYHITVVCFFYLLDYLGTQHLNYTSQLQKAFFEPVTLNPNLLVPSPPRAVTMTPKGYIATQATLENLEKRPANDFIESLGLKNYSVPGAPRPSFRHSTIVSSLYDSTQVVVASIASCMSQRLVKASLSSEGFLDREAELLFHVHGDKVWGEIRDHLISAAPDTLYPHELHADSPGDRIR